MTLLQKQQVFAQRLGKLLTWIYGQPGMGCTIGEGWRPDAVAEIYAQLHKGIHSSLHKIRLAIDLNLFRDGVFLTAPVDYRAAGEFWESLSDDEAECNWGGHFTKIVDGQTVPAPDADHFSVTWENVR